jgi:histidinol-phosphate aminotransferase
MAPIRVRPEVLDFEPYVPGLSIDEIKSRFGLERVIKMASNENPLGTSDQVRKAVLDHAGSIHRYPRAGSPDLVRALAGHCGVEPECIVAGNGSDEIIDLLIRAMARPGIDNIVAFSPCFSIYRLQARLSGVEFRQAPLGKDFTFDWDGLMGLVDHSTALVFVTSPDNPSGYAPPVEELLRCASALPEGCLLVVDEAYMDFAVPQDRFSLLGKGRLPENVAILRTFSKMHGLAGLRLGYGILPARLADILLRIKLPFSVNILAEAAGMAALKDSAFAEATLSAVVQGREYLASALSGLGCTVYPSQANFLLVRPQKDARLLYEGLLARGLIIRYLRSYGMPACVRVSIGTMAENEELVRNIEELL